MSPGDSTGQHRYTMGYRDEWRQVLDRRSAPSNAGHLLPHLRPGMRVLDLGCGPGSISIGLAQAVAPGKLYGIDLERSQVDIARAGARAAGVDNAEFAVGDAVRLPFADGFFDVAHCHALLMHVANPARSWLKCGGSSDPAAYFHAAN